MSGTSSVVVIVIAIWWTVVEQSSGLQVVLLDTTTTETLNWKTFSRAEGESRRGWREASYSDRNGDVMRVYTVCNVAVQAVDNWLRTPYIAPSPGNRLNIDVQFSMRKCTKYPNPGRLQQCKESFKLLYREVDSELADSDSSMWSEDFYRHVDVIAADRVFIDSNDAVINSESRSVSISSGRGVYFVFRDQGACATILSIRVYYLTCPAVVAGFAMFPDTPAGPEVTSIVQRDGLCVENAVPLGGGGGNDAGARLPSYLCKADGGWYFQSGGCQCLPGYEPTIANGTVGCVACPPHSYKWSSGTATCQPCPPRSDSADAASTSCKCHDGYFRSATDDAATSSCSGPPSTVLDLAVIHRDQSTINLTWTRPTDLGHRDDLTYKVECIGCDERVVIVPASSGFNTTSASLMNLSPGYQYKIIVHAENGVSSVANSHHPADVFVVTETTVPTKIRNLRITSVGTDHMTLHWDVQKRPRLHVDLYEVRNWITDDVTSEKSNITAFPNFTTTHLAQGTKYSFKVRGHSNKGWGEYSDVVTATTGYISHYPADNPAGIIVGSAVAVVICMIIVVAMVAIFIKRNSRCAREKHIIDYDDVIIHGTLQSPRNADGSFSVDNRVAIPLFSKPGNYARTYVDPHTYEDPTQAVREFTKEIDASFITIEAVIGGGEFGDVCKGQLRVPGKSALAVAIKTLKPGTSDKNRLDFLTEASIMGQFNDPNVIYLQGVVTRCHPAMIVTEYMENGSLDAFLRMNDGKFSIAQLIGMIHDIASGMCYLSGMGYVHRDLAARNILVDSNMTCKVSDFGLSREVEADSAGGVYTTKGGKIPVRWTAPEAIAYRKFTSASDVWSYGVVVWEVISYGERPYWNWTNQDVIKAIDKGYRLPPPMDCPETVYQLMLDCWEKERADRPKFIAIARTLEKLAEFPELLVESAKTRSENIPCYVINDVIEPVPATATVRCWSMPPPPSAAITGYSSVDEWLADIKMDRYGENFARCGYTTMERVASITHRDLATTLGISLVGHQKKILNSVQAMRAAQSQALPPPLPATTQWSDGGVPLLMRAAPET